MSDPEIEQIINVEAAEESEDDVDFNVELPGGAEIAEGSVYIADVDAFMAETKSIAAMIINGQLFVLRADTLKFMKIQDVRAEDCPKPERKIRVLKKPEG